VDATASRPQAIRRCNAQADPEGGRSCRLNPLLVSRITRSSEA
jgi:hypothetical protein